MITVPLLHHWRSLSILLCFVLNESTISTAIHQVRFHYADKLRPLAAPVSGLWPLLSLASAYVQESIVLKRVDQEKTYGMQVFGVPGFVRC